MQGRHVAQWLLARGETVVDVLATATARVRELSAAGAADRRDRRRGSRCRNRRPGEVPTLAIADTTTVLALLDERRSNVAAPRFRLVSQLPRLPTRHGARWSMPTPDVRCRACTVLRGIRGAGVVQRPDPALRARDRGLATFGRNFIGTGTDSSGGPPTAEPSAHR